MVDLTRLEIMRNALTVLFNALTFVGYGLILTALMSLAADRGTTITAQKGFVWGLCGFLAVQFAPAISLAPEVPGMASAEVTPRQIWWTTTVAATGTPAADRCSRVSVEPEIVRIPVRWPGGSNAFTACTCISEELATGTPTALASSA